MIILSKYRIQKEANGILKVVDMPPSFCNECGKKMKVRDSRLRRLLDEDGAEHWLRHRRLRCEVCRTVHSEFPDFVMPGKHYAACVILEQFFSEFIEQDSGICSAENNTIRKWISEITCQVQVIFLFLWEAFAWNEIRRNIIKMLNFLESLLIKQLKSERYRKFVGWLYIFRPQIHFSFAV